MGSAWTQSVWSPNRNRLTTAAVFFGHAGQENTMTTPWKGQRISTTAGDSDERDRLTNLLNS
jgi:hypothetical protein